MTERWRVGEAVGARRLRRRQVLAGLGGLASAALLAACGATDPTPTPGTAVSAGGATTTAAKSSTTAQSTSTAASTTAAASASSSKATTSTASSATTTSSAATSAATTPATSTTAAASSAPAASGPAVSLEFWTINLKKNFNDYIQGMIDAYQKDYPNITIKWVDVPGAEIDTKLLTALSGGAAPDTVNVTSNSLFKYRGALTDLKQYAGNQMSGYLDNLVTACQQDGKQVAIPWYYGGPAIAYYNPDIISQAGLDLNSAPKTYDDLLAWGDTIHTKTNIYGSNTFPDYSVFMQEGITLLSDDKKKATFNTPDAAAVLAKFLKAYKSGSIAPGVVGKDSRVWPQTVDNGQIAMTGSGGAFTLNNIQKNSPPIFEKLAIKPAVVGKTGKLLVLGMQTFAVPAKSKHPKEAADFAFYVTNAANQLAFCKLVAIFPTTKNTLSDPFFTNIDVKTKLDEARKIMVAESPIVADGTLGTGFDSDLNDLFSEEIRACFLGQKDPAAALADAEKQWNARIAKGA